MTYEPPVVRLVDGDDASGFASMLADVLEANVSDYRGRAWVAARARGAVVLRASDRDVAVTVMFGPGGVDIEDGARPGVPVLAGPWLTMADLCSGSVSPLRAMAARELHVRPTARVDMLGAAGYVLSVPASYYNDSDDVDDPQWRTTRTAVALAAGGAVVIVGVWLLARRRQRRQWIGSGP